MTSFNLKLGRDLIKMEVWNLETRNANLEQSLDWTAKAISNRQINTILYIY